MTEQQHNLSPEETKQVSEVYVKYISKKWLWFYTYIRLPLSILLSLNQLITAKDISFLVGLIGMGLIILLICNYVGLSRRTAWGYKLNWYVLVIECLLFPFEPDLPPNYIELTPLLYLALAGLCFLIWFYPNLIYFTKRRDLFIQEEQKEDTK